MSTAAPERVPASRWLPWLLIGLATGALAVRLAQNFPRLVDLDILFTAAQRFFGGEGIFRHSDLVEHTKPPLASYLLGALLLAPGREALFVFWHGVNLLLPLVWLRSQRGHVDWAVAAAMLGGFNFWFTETNLGQYNLILAATLWLAFHRPRAWLAGLLFSLAPLLKPSFIVFLPWFLVGADARRARELLLGMAALPALLAVVYVLDRGLGAFVADHLEWLAFLGFSEARHMERIDNLCFPSLLQRGTGWVLPSPVWLLAGAAANALALRRLGPSPAVVGYSLCALGFLAFSPMTWRQNFVVLLPMLAWSVPALWSERRWRPATLALLAVPFAISPVGVPEALRNLAFATAAPLWSMIALFALALGVAPSQKR